ncbi:MAG TPA: helix-hairpin-helix domain-containing protein [Thermoanaerobaculia bacterium]|nr:helix-hairpin-helix domain-containing protein [Thermoanaerobaculia bacterium]
MSNQRIANALREAGDLLHEQGANPFRMAAYHRAADTVAGLDRDLWDILDREGVEGLTELPHIGHGIAGAIREMLVTGRWGQLDRLRGTADPVRLFQRLPGIGPGLARQIHETLDVETLEALEAAAHDGRLESVPGVGPRRAALIRANLAELLSRRPGPRRIGPIAEPAAGPAADRPGVETLLDVDREYRERAAAGTLPAIAPRRFNPERIAWLPILHTERGRSCFTALFSNTARAHDLRKTRDWVVLYCYDDHHREQQHTVVTETRGPLAGRRVVRGREDECRAFYAREAAAA